MTNSAPRSTPVRVLMSEGSSLSARESLTALGLAGFRVEVVDPNPLCLTRFSKWCTKVHASPKFGADPRGYLEFVEELLARERFDVLYPAHEQAFLFARHRNALEHRTHLALPPFEIFERMQSKVGFAGVLEELGLPTAPTVVIHDPASFHRAVRHFPVYVKAAFGTAEQATFCIRSVEELSAAADALGDVFSDGVLVQEPLEGRLARTQAVFAAGRLVGFHACVQVEEGVNGGDLVKESVEAPIVREHLIHLGRRLGWHGGLSLDYLTGADGEPHYIDSNPRLAETGNGLAAGVNLPELLVLVSLGRAPPGCHVGRPGVRTFMGIQGLLEAARRTGSRRHLARTILDLARRRGRFACGTEELTPTEGTLRAHVPLAMVGAALLARPALGHYLASSTVDAYAATPRVVDFVRQG